MCNIENRGLRAFFTTPRKVCFPSTLMRKKIWKTRILLRCMDCQEPKSLQNRGPNCDTTVTLAVYVTETEKLQFRLHKLLADQTFLEPVTGIKENAVLDVRRALDLDTDDVPHRPAIGIGHHRAFEMIAHFDADFCAFRQ